jgi:glucose/arabinose dehydrogenase
MSIRVRYAVPMTVVTRTHARLAAVVGLILVTGACATDASPAATFPPVSGTAAATASPSGDGSATPSASAVVSPTDDGGLPRPDLSAVRVALAPVVDGLDAPIFVTAANDGSDRLFVPQQGGVIRLVRDGALEREPFVDLTNRVQAGGERGLLGLAFPPGFGAERPQLYVDYTDRDGNTTVSELTVDPSNPDRADPASERLILKVTQPYPNHNGGWIGFDADGMLLIGLGDGGSGGDPENRASNPDELLGKILRLDVLGAGGKPYAIPTDNPFVGRAGTRPEILHWGLRNPFRASVDLETHDLWIGDVGQNAWEEVDVARADARGLDFGWRRWEGSHCYDKSAGCVKDGVTMPVTEYSHSDGCSVIGGVIYRGDAIPALRGAYLFGDYCSGKLWAIDAGLDAPQAPILLAETGLSISSIGIDEEGEVYLTDLGGGTVVKLRANPDCCG